MTDPERQAYIERIADQLAEVADAVQVLCSYTDAEDSTHCIKTGSGNWYARIAMAREFLTEDRARTAEYATHDACDCDEGDDE